MKYLSVTILLIICVGAASQEAIREQAVALRFNKKKIRLLTIPYNNVEVLDNRFDKSCVFIDQTGEYPVTTFIANASTVIENYFEEVASQLSNGKETLVIDLQEFRVPNRRMPLERKGKSSTSQTLGSRHHIRLSATCYYKSQSNLYRKVVTINKKYDTYYPAVPIQRTIERILNDVIQSATIGFKESISLEVSNKLKYLVTDSTSFCYESDRAFKTIEEINVPIASRWRELPILTRNETQNGVYRTFKNFQEDSVKKESFSMIAIKEDSLFKIFIPKTEVPRKFSLPYAVVDHGKVYIRVLDSIYVPAYRENSSFYFFLPWSLPDMYALLSIDEVRARNSNSISPSGNIFADLIVSAGSILVDEISRSSEERKIFKRGLNHSFRYCAINMNTGDFIYRSSKPHNTMP